MNTISMKEGIIRQWQEEYACYKYTVYRCAMKFRALQNYLNVSPISYKLVQFIIKRHALTDNGNLMIPPFQLTYLLQDIYLGASMLGELPRTDSVHLERITSIFANFFWDVFDPQRRHSVSLLEIQLTLLLLCKLYKDDCQLVNECFALLVENETRCVPKLRFECMLNIFIKLFTFLGEGNAYGAHNLPQIMEQCYNNEINTRRVGLTERQFQQLWTRTHNRFIVFANLIALIQRLADTEKFLHNHPCAACGIERIVGLRFKCQTCRELSLCLKCFASGYITYRHKSSHRACEVFTEEEPQKKFSSYMARLCGYNSIKCEPVKDSKNIKNCHSNVDIGGSSGHVESKSFELKMGPLMVNNTAEATATLNHCDTVNMQQQSEMISLPRVTATASDTSKFMEGITQRLLQENAKLEAQLKTTSTSTHAEIASFLETHKNKLIEIIDDMHSLARTSMIGRNPFQRPNEHVTSTPNQCAKQKTNDSEIPVKIYEPASIGANLSHSIDGAEINRSYIEANRSDYSLRDVSFWFSSRRPTTMSKERKENPTRYLSLESLDTNMTNFRHLLKKVKEIVDDSYSDNAELSEATQNLENVLDGIILKEERRRSCEI